MTLSDIEQPLNPVPPQSHQQVSISEPTDGSENPRRKREPQTASQGSLRRHLHTVMQQEHNAGVGDGGLRAAVFGFLDGLVSNLCLILGVYAAVSSGDTSVQTLLLTGLSGLMAGAASMSTGEWISMKAQDEAEIKELSTERRHLMENYDDEAEEFAEYLSQHGVSAEVAALVTRDIRHSHAPVENMLDMHARFELGIDPDEAGGSAPIRAAFFSFATFATGAIIPLSPWLVVFILQKTNSSFQLTGDLPVILTLVLSAVSLFAAGAILARYTGLSPWYSGFRQLIVASLAAGACLAVGSLFGVAVQ